MHQSRPFNSKGVHDLLWWVALCLPLKIRGIKKATWDKNLKIQGVILKARRDLIQVQKHHEKRRIQRNAQKLKFLRKELNVEALQIQIENLFET
jgi:hypothetical protein